MKHYVQCSGCKSCYQECRLQMDAISYSADGLLVIDLERCNRCGHCVAVCPTGEMDHPLSRLQEELRPLPAPEEALRFLRAPRSVRRFEQRLVPRELLLNLLDAGRYPQTAKNSQGVHYHVVRGRERVAQIHDLYFKIVSTLSKDDPDYDILIRPVNVQRAKGFDALLYNCPQLIFAVCDEKSTFDPRNAQFSLTFISLMAPSLGLGTCWGGQIQRLAGRKEYMSRFSALIGLKEDQRICGCMMVGYPAVAFRRYVERDPLQVSWWE